MISSEVEAGLNWACFEPVWLSLPPVLCVLACLFSSQPVKNKQRIDFQTFWLLLSI
jgi:hypothetical protein